MKKLIVLTCLMIITIAGAANAQERNAEQHANDLLKKASNKIKGYASMEVDFSYTMENSQMNINESMRGKVLAKGDKYRMTIGDNVFISDGRTVWNYIDDLDEIHINTVENSEGGLSPTALLSDFEKQFNAKFIKQETYKGKLVDIIDLVPNAPQSFFKYRLALDTRDQSLIYTTAYDRHGGTYTYTIETLKPNPNLPDSRFVFNRNEFPATVDVIDMR
jgi:outer membrane lipoprotein carrier protein